MTARLLPAGGRPPGWSLALVNTTSSKRILDVKLGLSKQRLGWAALSICSLASLASGGCGRAARTPKGLAAPRGGDDPDRSSVVPMEPIQIVGDKGGGKGDAFTPSELFSRAMVHYRTRRFSKAAHAFNLLLKHFPGSPHAGPARYNLALCLEKLGKPAQAAVEYGRYLKRDLQHEERLKAMARRATAFFRAEMYGKAAKAFGEIASDPDATARQQLVGEVNGARALIEAGKLDEAEASLRSALRLDELLARTTERPDRSLGAEATYLLAEVFRGRMRRVRLDLPEGEVGKALYRKAQIFSKARRHYLSVARFSEPRWTARGLLGLARMLEDFFWDVVHAPVPRFRPVRYFDAEQGKWKVISSERLEKRYVEKVKRKLRLVLASAVKIYSTTEARARRQGLEAEWTETSRRQVRRVRRLLASLGSLQLGPSEGRGSQPGREPSSGGVDVFGQLGGDRPSAEDYFPETIPL